MSPKATQLRIGIGMLLLGLVAVAIGIVGAASSGGGDATAVAAGEAPQTTRPTAAPTVSEATLPTETPQTPPTVAPSPTATSAPQPTSTPVPEPTPQPAPRESLEEFGQKFNAANTDGDPTFAFERLHPVVIEIFGSELCQQWLAARFSSTTVSFVGQASELGTTTFNLPSGEVVEVSDYFTVAVELTFQGAVTATEAGYAYVDGNVNWFTNCEAT